MNLGTVINVSIGLIMTFAVMALVVSAVREAWANFAKARSASLVEGVKALLNDPNLNDLAKQVLNHAAVNPLAPGAAGRDKTVIGGSLPDSVKPAMFADALIDVIQGRAPGKPLGEIIDQIDDPQIKQVLQGAYHRAKENVDEFHKEVATWFDAAMERVGDNYRRHAQAWSFWIALGLALLLNVDTFHIAQAIWMSPDMVNQINALGQTGADAAKDLAALASAGFPVGWSDAERAALLDWTDPAKRVWWVFVKLVGCGFTASASMLGAPFWFDLLTKVRGVTTPAAPAQATTPAPTPTPAPVAVPAIP